MWLAKLLGVVPLLPFHTLMTLTGVGLNIKEICWCSPTHSHQSFPTPSVFCMPCDTHTSFMMILSDTQWCCWISNMWQHQLCSSILHVAYLLWHHTLALDGKHWTVLMKPALLCSTALVYTVLCLVVQGVTLSKVSSKNNLMGCNYNGSKGRGGAAG